MIRPLGSMFVDVGNDPRRPARVMTEQVVSRASFVGGGVGVFSTPATSKAPAGSPQHATRNGAAVSIDDTASSGRPNQGDGMTHGRLPSPAFSEHPSVGRATARDVHPSASPGARGGTVATASDGPATSHDNPGRPLVGVVRQPGVSSTGRGSSKFQAPSARPSRVWRFFFTGDLRRLR